MSVTDESLMQAFVLMPFDPAFEQIYRDLITPALEEVGYEVRRADSVLTQQNILRDIVESIVRADLIVAELTLLNPNVMYELGIAHALGKPTVMLAQRISDVPFDLRSYRIIPYSENFREIHKLRDALKAVGEQHRRGVITFGNPVTDFAPASSVPVMASDERGVSVPVSAVVEDNRGWLDVQVDLEEAQQNITTSMGSLNRITVQFNADSTPVFENISRRGNQALSASQRRALLLSAATVISRFAASMENEIPGLRTAWESFGSNSDKLAASTPLSGDADRESARQAIAALDEFEQVIRSTLVSIAGIKEPIEPFRGITAELTQALNWLTRVLDELVGVMEIGLSGAARVKNIIRERMEGL